MNDMGDMGDMGTLIFQRNLLKGDLCIVEPHALSSVDDKARILRTGKKGAKNGGVP